jgi:hypothetical protein
MAWDRASREGVLSSYSREVSEALLYTEYDNILIKELFKR